MTDFVSASRVQLPREAIGQALRSVARNSLQASSSNATVRIACRLDENRLHIEIADDGCGMTEAIAQRATEPFFTTRANGAGMGLGLFLARSVVERLGGSLEIQSQVGVGTTATIGLPLDALTMVTA